jgi:hypothetical protein
MKMGKLQYTMLLIQSPLGGSLLPRSLQNMTSRYVGTQYIWHINIYSTDLFLETLFLESMCDDPRIIEENVRRVKISSPDVSLFAFPNHVPLSLNVLVCGLGCEWCYQTLLGSNLGANTSIRDYGGTGSQLHKGRPLRRLFFFYIC